MRSDFAQARHRGLLSIVLILTVLLVGMIILVPAAATPDRPTPNVPARNVAFNAWYANGSDALQKAVNEQHWYEHAALDHFYAVVAWNAAIEHNAEVAAEAKAAKPKLTPKPSPSVPAVHHSAPSSSGGGAGGFFACIRQRESGNNYSENTGNGYYGAYQFLISTWNSTARRHADDLLPTKNDDGTDRYGRDLIGVRPDLAGPSDQDQMALWLLQDAGRGQWSTSGACS